YSQHRYAVEDDRKPGSVPGDGSGSEVRLDLLEDGVLAASADQPRPLLAGPEHDQGGDAHDAVASRGLRVVVDVQLDGLQGVGVVAGDLFDDRRDHMTGHTP